MANKYENIYTDIDELPIYNFYKCVDGRLNFMYRDRKGEENVIVRKEWNKIYNQYCKLTYNNSTLKYYRLVGEIEFLKNRKIFAPILLGLLLKTPKNELKHILEELKKWKIRININNDIDKEIEKGLRVLKNSENTLTRKSNELESMNEKPKKVLSLQSQKARVHKNIGISVDLHNTSVSEWLAYLDEELKQMKSNEQ